MWIILILIFLFQFQIQVQAQSKKYFIVTGKIVPETGDTGIGSIEIKRNETDIKNIEIPKNGRFRFELEFFNEYFLTFKYPGHFNKIILVSTEIPKEVWERDNDFPPFPMIVQMQQEFEGIDKSFTLKPQGRIFYGKEIDNFEKESYISDIQFQEQIETAKAKADQVQKEAQTISKVDAQDLAAKQKNFDQLIKEADAHYQRGEYQMALMKYMDAQKLFPDKAYPNDRVAELQDLVKALEITEKQKAELEQKYKETIAKANGFFDLKSYISARPLYEEALQYKPGDVFANGRISEIDQLLALQEKQKQYNDIIVKADNDYKSKNYDQAVAQYTQAKLLVPNDTYPQKQIDLINQEKLAQAKLDQLEEDFSKAMQSANTMVRQKDFVQALDGYKKALELKPDNQLAREKIAQTEKEISLQEADKKYQQAIQLADQAMASNDLQKAKMQYQEALKIKLGEAYPKTKLDEIAAGEAKEIEFNGLVAQGEKAFADKNFDLSLQQLTRALEIKPKEANVQKRIDEIKNLLKIQQTDQEYSDLISQADKDFNNNRLDASLTAYNKALSIKKAEAYPKDQIQKIELYQAQIKKADKLIDSRDYQNALTALGEAETAKPNDPVVKEKSATIEKLLAEKKQQEEKAIAELNAYNEEIKKADQLFSDKKYPESLAGYKQALTIKGTETYPKKQIREIETILDQLAKEQAKKDKDYQTLVSLADNLMGKKDFGNAKTTYQRALEIKSDEAYPKSQIQKIDDSVAQLQREEQEKQRALREKTDQEFNLAMADADKAFGANDFNLAKTGYQNALSIKPNEPTAKDKLGQTEAKLAQIAKMTLAYNNAINEANRQLTAKKYKEAKEKYQEALQYLPDMEYPQKQISKIDEVLAQQEAEIKLRQDFDQAVAEGENLLRNKELGKAKDAYMKAYNLIPSEPVPPRKIAEINDLLAEQARKDAELKATLAAYQEAIQRADKHFGNKDYSSAKLVYNEALLLKSDEKYPVDQLDLIDKLLADQNEQQYKSAIAKADNSFDGNQLDQAKTSYNEALKYKKNDSYAIRRLKEIDQKLADLEAENNRLKKLQGEYNALIADAGVDFKNKEYQNAKGKYQKALALKPAEVFPKEQIAKIDQLLAELQKEEDINRQYVQHIKLAQDAFAQNKLKEARDEYQKAYNFKPFEPIPPARIAEIDKMLAQQAEAAQLAAMEEAQRLAKEKADKEQYDKAIAAADKSFAEKQYKIARNHYTTALIALPNEQYPKNQITKIDELLAQQEMDKALALQKAQQDSLLKAREKLYDLAMTAASQFIQQKEYQQAIIKYGEAMQINPAKRPEIQPLINDAEDKLQLMAKQDQEYKRLIKLADEQFGNSKLEVALAQYQNAQKIKPTEEYPKKQIAEIQSILATREQNYAAAIQKADQAFNASNWLNAKTGYTEALSVKPQEIYPATRLKEVNQKIIDANLAALAKAGEDKAYQEAIDKGEKAIKENQLTSAKMQFEMAKSLKPNEKLPVDRIREIEAMINQRNKDLLAQTQREIDEKYSQAISVADNSFKQKSYSIAKLQYKQASLIKPDETYPKDQMALCDKLIAEAALQETYVMKLPVPEPVVRKNENVATAPVSTQATEAEANSYTTVTDYNEAIKRADDSFGIKDYSVARFFYLRASDIREKEEYPKNQVELIRKLIDSQMSSNDISAYDNAISQADAAFARQNYTIAKFYYYKALEIKSWEKYPKDRINEILALTNSLLSEKEEKEYRDAIAKADEAFFSKDISISRFYYNKALAIKKDENYPRIKLKDIQKLIEQDRLDQQSQEYQKIIDQADQAMQTENFSIARFNYNKALTMKPEEKYPKDQLKKIREALDNQKK
jgi:hypothetical protein